MASGDIGSKHWISLSIAGQGWQQTFITWSCIRPHIGHSILWGLSGGRGPGMHPDSPHSPSGIICIVSLHIDLLYGFHSRPWVGVTQRRRGVFAVNPYSQRRLHAGGSGTGVYLLWLDLTCPKWEWPACMEGWRGGGGVFGLFDYSLVLYRLM